MKMDELNAFCKFQSSQKSLDRKFVFTNGCFDILHRGHVEYLKQAKNLGDYLIIGLNSDLSVKKLKGNSRPINKEEDRKFLLLNLKWVDFVFIFHEDTPLNLIKKINPDFLVKGGDWKVEQIVGSDYILGHGGKVLSLPFIDGHSTTKIIEKSQIKSN